MAVCNLFKTLGTNSNDGQGIFFTFSQYAEDLTKQQTEGEHYRVSPSKFACLNLIPTSATNIPETLQDLYENKVSYFREITDDDEYQWDNFDASIFLWSALAKDSIITESGSGDTAYYSQLKYVGDIDIYSNEVINGTNYSEIYCLVPPDAAATKYYNITNTGDSFTYESADQTIINGWTDATYPDGTGLGSTPEFDNSTNYTYTGEKYPYILSDSDLSNVATSSLYIVDTESSTGFKFNTMILFYDVVNEDNDVIIRNLPLGIWFSGGYNASGASDEKLYNFVNKFTASNTVYGQGTSYGLRVCTKLIGTPFGTANEINVGSTDGEYDSLSAVCEAFTETLNELDKIYDKLELNQDSMADYLNNFTSGKVNVPYIRNISGMYYWFINGRNTNIPVCYVGNNENVIPIQSNWTEDNEDLPSFIQNKPVIGNGEITIKQGDNLIGKFSMNQTKDLEIPLPKIEAANPTDTTTPSFVTPAEKSEWDSKSAVTGENDGTNWTSLTIDGTTKNISSSGSNEIKKLNTTATTSQTTSSDEAITGTGTVNLHKISKTGHYNDLIGKPVIPVPGEGILTITKNSENFISFNANQSNNITKNLVIPEKLTELSDIAIQTNLANGDILRYNSTIPGWYNSKEAEDVLLVEFTVTGAGNNQTITSSKSVEEIINALFNVKSHKIAIGVLGNYLGGGIESYSTFIFSGKEPGEGTGTHIWFDSLNGETQNLRIDGTQTQSATNEWQFVYVNSLPILDIDDYTEQSADAYTTTINNTSWPDGFHCYGKWSELSYNNWVIELDCSFEGVKNYLSIINNYSGTCSIEDIRPIDSTITDIYYKNDFASSDPNLPAGYTVIEPNETAEICFYKIANTYFFEIKKFNFNT